MGRAALQYLVLAAFLLGRLLPPAADVARRALGVPPEALLNFTETCAAHRYRAEQHDVRTADGYLLRLFRVGRAGCAPRRPPVLLMHGLLQSADSFLDAGPRAGLPYLLADRCFDVWVGNTRGSHHARRHERLDPDRDAEFWDFSIDDIGLHDIPATVDYVLNHTGSPKLNHVGYSQGGSSFFIMCAERPGYCDKVGLHVSLAPAVRLTNLRSLPFRAVAAALAAVGGGEVFARGSLLQELGSLLCRVGGGALCGGVLALIDAPHPGSIADETLPRVFANFPAGASAKMFVKYAQSLRSEGFEKFDHGAANERVYGAARPPAYELRAVTAPVLLLYGDNDGLVDARDVRWLRARLPRVVAAVRVADPLWNHFDFAYSRHIPTLLFPHLHEHLARYSEPDE